MCRPYDNQLRFRKADFEKIPADAIGIYGLWFKKRCLYVGKAEDQPIAKRLKRHWDGTHNPELAAWIQAKGSELRVAYLVAEEKSKITALERLYIRRFQPLTNRIRYNSSY